MLGLLACSEAYEFGHAVGHWVVQVYTVPKADEFFLLKN